MPEAVHEPVERARRVKEVRAYTLPVVPHEDAERPFAERVEADRALVMLDLGFFYMYVFSIFSSNCCPKLTNFDENVSEFKHFYRTDQNILDSSQFP